MKVVDERTKRAFKVNDLHAGDTFIYENVLYMLVGWGMETVCVVELETGCFYDDFIERCDYVIPVNVECHIVGEIQEIES